MKSCLTLLMTIGIILCAIGQNSLPNSVYFETAKHDLSTDAIKVVDNFLKNVPSLDDYTIEIMAHTDSRGSVSYNQALANRRAKAVEDYN